MAIKSSRTVGVAEVSVDQDNCIGCQLCIKVCTGGPLYVENGRVGVDQARGFGCIGCGQCMAVCPQGCITVNGRCFSAADVVEQSPDATATNYNALFNLMLKRRSIRNFSNREVNSEDINKILAAAATAPMGIPPSEVGVVVVAGTAKVAAFRADLIAQIRRMNWLLAKPMVYIMRPFMGKDAFEGFVSFVPDLFRMLAEADSQGEDGLFYNAPLVLVFHASSFGDPVDAYIAATYAMLAGEAQGLGSCMIGSVAPVLKNGKQLKQKYGIPVKNQPAIAMVFGYPDPAVEYRRVIRRTFADVHMV